MGNTVGNFAAGLIMLAIIAVLVTKPNTATVVGASGKAVSETLSAAEAG